MSTVHGAVEEWQDGEGSVKRTWRQILRRSHLRTPLLLLVTHFQMLGMLGHAYLSWPATLRRFFDWCDLFLLAPEPFGQVGPRARFIGVAAIVPLTVAVVFECAAALTGSLHGSYGYGYLALVLRVVSAVGAALLAAGVSLWAGELGVNNTRDSSVSDSPRGWAIAGLVTMTCGLALANLLWWGAGRDSEASAGDSPVSWLKRYLVLEQCLGVVSVILGIAIMGTISEDLEPSFYGTAAGCLAFIQGIVICAAAWVFLATGKEAASDESRRKKLRIATQVFLTTLTLIFIPVGEQAFAPFACESVDCPLGFQFRAGDHSSLYTREPLFRYTTAELYQPCDFTSECTVVGTVCPAISQSRVILKPEIVCSTEGYPHLLPSGALALTLLIAQIVLVTRLIDKSYIHMKRELRCPWRGENGSRLRARLAHSPAAALYRPFRRGWQYGLPVLLSCRLLLCAATAFLASRPTALASTHLAFHCLLLLLHVFIRPFHWWWDTLLASLLHLMGASVAAVVLSQAEGHTSGGEFMVAMHVIIPVFWLMGQICASPLHTHGTDRREIGTPAPIRPSANPRPPPPTAGAHRFLDAATILSAWAPPPKVAACREPAHWRDPTEQELEICKAADVKLSAFAMRKVRVLSLALLLCASAGLAANIAGLHTVDMPLLPVTAPFEGSQQELLERHFPPPLASWAEFIDACCCRPAPQSAVNTTEEWVCGPEPWQTVRRARKHSGLSGLGLRDFCSPTFREGVSQPFVEAVSGGIVLRVQDTDTQPPASLEELYLW